MNQTWENSKKSNLRPNFASFAPNLNPNFFPSVLPLLDIRNCCKLSLYAILRKINDPNSQKWWKPHFGPNLHPSNLNSGRQFFFFFFFFKNIDLSVTGCPGKLSSGTISDKLVIQSWEKWSEGQIERWTRVDKTS